MRLVLEANQRGLEHAHTFDINAVRTVDQNVVDGRIFEQWLDRAKARHFVDNFAYEVVEFLRVQRDALRKRELRNHRVDLATNFLIRKLVHRREIKFLDHLAVQSHLGIEHLARKQ